MGKGIQFWLNFLDFYIKNFYHFIFGLKLTFFLFEILYLKFLSVDFTFKIRNFYVLLLSDGLDDLFLLFGDSFDNFFFLILKNIFDFWKVGFDYLSHSAQVLKQRGNLLLQGWSEEIRDFWLHLCNDALDLFLTVSFVCFVWYKAALEFHNSLNYEL